MNFPKPPLQGNCRQTTIAAANTPQNLVDGGPGQLVRQVTVVPDGANTGDVLMSLGPGLLMPSLQFDAGDGWIDLYQIQIKSTVMGDKVNFQSVYAP